MTGRQLYTEIKVKLKAAGITAAVESKVIFETATGKKCTDFSYDAEISDETADMVFKLVNRRADGEPLQYIAGRWPFLDFELDVGEGVLIPRPETENTALAAIGYLHGAASPAILDLCSGTGCIAIAIKRAVPGSDVTAVEFYGAAYAFLRRNATRLTPDTKTVQADVFGYDSVLLDSALDMIVSNPPYVTPDEYGENIAELGREPQTAFLGGTDGLDFYRYIIANYKDKLKPGGTMIFETGFNQTEAVEKLFFDAGYQDIATIYDDFGLPRMVAAKR